MKRSRSNRKFTDKIALTAIGLFCVLASLLVYGWISVPLANIPPFDEVKRDFKTSDVGLYDRNGKLLHEIRMDYTFRRLEWAPLANISPALVKALIFSEDRRFYNHYGVDWLAAPSAVLTRGKRGGSTISMQLMAILDIPDKPNKSKSINWKLWQTKNAINISQQWTKDQILEAYLNFVSFRGELRGITAAARGIFGKEPGGLDEAESAVLVALIRAPNAKMEAVVKRAHNITVGLGKEMAFKEVAAVAAPIDGKKTIPPRESLAPHITRSILNKGINRSTLDYDTQKFVSDAVKRHITGLRDKNVKDAAAIVVDNDTGEVLAYVGGAGLDNASGLADGIVAKRQAGSTLKPFLYATAIERRLLTAASPLEDTPFEEKTARGPYRPENYDKRFRGYVTVRSALAASINIPAVRTLKLVGVENFILALESVGFRNLKSARHYGLSLALGTADVSLLELATAYRALANGGDVSPLKIVFDDGEDDEVENVLSPETAFIISDILADREARSETFGFETPLSTGFWSAVKTGTSKDMRDNWCIGYTGNYTVGVWVGNFSGEQMWNVSGVTGAAPLWSDIAGYLHGRDPAPTPTPPDSLIRKNVYIQPAQSWRVEYFLPGTVPPDMIGQTPAPQRNMIVYPADGEIIAIDPDISPDRQKVMFDSVSNTNNTTWLLNGKTIGEGRRVIWSPAPGKYELSLICDARETCGHVWFIVR